MTQFNDTVKNVAIENIVSFLKNPEGKSSMAQVSLIIETVQNAFVTNDDEKDAQATLVRFLETYINKLAARADGEIPDFLNGIIGADTTPTVSSVAQILARLRCNAVKEEYSDFIINHLTYFIEYLKDKYGACTHVCKKFRIVYSDYSNVISEVTKWALEAYNPPILIQFNSKDEWEDFRTRTLDEGHYACQFNGSALALTRKTNEIDKFDSSKYPMEVRIKGTKEFPDEMRNIPQEEIDAFWFSIRGYKETRLQKFINRQVEAIENFVKQNKKILIGTGVSIAAMYIIILIVPVIRPIIVEKLGVKQEIYERSYTEYGEASEETYQSSTGTSNEPKVQRPSWIEGQWRCPLEDGMGALIVNLWNNKTSVKIMNGFSLVREIHYDGWTVLNDCVYLYKNGDRGADSPHFQIDYFREKLKTSDGQYMQKH